MTKYSILFQENLNFDAEKKSILNVENRFSAKSVSFWSNFNICINVDVLIRHSAIFLKYLLL